MMGTEGLSAGDILALRKPGFYFISFTGTGSVSGATAGTITVNLLKNGNSVPGQPPPNHQLPLQIFAQ